MGPHTHLVAECCGGDTRAADEAKHGYTDNADDHSHAGRSCPRAPNTTCGICETAPGRPAICHVFIAARAQAPLPAGLGDIAWLVVALHCLSETCQLLFFVLQILPAHAA